MKTHVIESEFFSLGHVLPVKLFFVESGDIAVLVSGRAADIAAYENRITVYANVLSVRRNRAETERSARFFLLAARENLAAERIQIRLVRIPQARIFDLEAGFCLASRYGKRDFRFFSVRIRDRKTRVVDFSFSGDTHLADTVGVRFYFDCRFFFRYHDSVG